jgi:putative hydrolase of the HAD superfamily
MLDWNAIDTVLLDMDGTLLDLHFDNFFWQHHLPARYAELHKIEPEAALNKLYKRFEEKRSSIEWYCTDFWSAELDLDIPALKKEVQHLIAERPHVRQFLSALGKTHRQRILITNAHRDSLNLKLDITGIDDLLDTLISSHDYNVPKELPVFWESLSEQIHFDPKRTLFIDDTEDMLRAAENFGIAHLLCISQPDSKTIARTDLKYPAIEHFSDLLPIN